MDMNDLVNTKEACMILGCSASKLCVLTKEDTFKTVIRKGNKLFYKIEEVEAYRDAISNNEKERIKKQRKIFYESKEYLSAQKVMQLLGLSIYNYRKAVSIGKLVPDRYLAGGKGLYHIDTLRKYAIDHELSTEAIDLYITELQNI